MKPYPKYKDSGVEWIGEIPERWHIAALKRLAAVRYGLGQPPKEKEGGVPLVRATDLHDGKIFLDKLVYVDPADVPKTRDAFLSEGEIIVVRSGAYTGDSAIIPNELVGGVAGYDMVVRCSRIRSDFLSRALLSSYIQKSQLEQSSLRAAQPHLNAEELGATSVVLPNEPEQFSIACYLDAKTAGIDTLIDKKRRQIELLKAYRASVISEAVTKGLSPSVHMKDSGVEWIGKIPEHWSVRRLKHLLVGKLQYGANESAENDDPTMPRYIRITDFGDDGKLHADTFKSLPMEVAKDYLLSEGDILFARSGATVGKTFQFKNYNGAACYAGYLIRAVPDPAEVLSDYLYFFTRSNAYENWKNSSFSQATIQNIGADKYQNLSVSHPSVDEQAEIVRFLDVKTRQIDGLIERGERQIESLQTYRTSLISEAVTGKIDVRDWAVA